MPNVTYSNPKKQHEWELANALAKFLPPQLVIRDFEGLPRIERAGLAGYFLDRVGYFTENTKVTITNEKWKDQIHAAIEKYEKESGAAIDLVIDNS